MGHHVRSLRLEVQDAPNDYSHTGRTAQDETTFLHIELLPHLAPACHHDLFSSVLSSEQHPHPRPLDRTRHVCHSEMVLAPW